MTPWDELTERSTLTCPPGGWKPTTIAAAIEAILAASAVEVRRSPLGASFEGRPIELLAVGSGEKRVLLWSQMHGDEPTHTSVLLNLLRLLTTVGAPGADGLLAGLTIGMIIPLNPDGAERNTRHNAQGIDVNRDALEFASPEGRALRQAIDEFAPHFAFNLHNQHHRTAIGSPPAPAAVSLLAPPVDEENTRTDSTEDAIRVAAYFYECVRDRCEGRVSRYDVEYMARAFGEWVQRRGVATVLVEAGGWPGGDFVVLERLHLAALVQTLEAIAENRLNEADPQVYEDLERSSDYHLFDLLLLPAAVAQRSDAAPNATTEAEVGVDYPHRKAGWYEFRDGVVRAIGDLHENGGLNRVERPDAVLAPGRIVLAEAVEDVTDLEPADWDSLTAVGATTALAPIDLATADFPSRLETMLATPPPINAALVGTWGAADGGASFHERLATARAAGLAAMIEPLPDAVAEFCRRLGLPILAVSEAPRAADAFPASLEDWLAEAAATADRLGWTNRGRIALNAAADFVLIDKSSSSLTTASLRSVFVGGTVVRDDDGPTPHTPGRWLRS